jgi:putative ABC transport system ATP-binding protein
MSDWAIDCRKVTKVYGKGATAYQALRGVDFQVRRGEFVMLAGPSGSGKTTLLSIMGCVLGATEGTVGLLGRDITHASEAAMAQLRLGYIGFVFQAHNLIASMTATENIAMLLALRGIPPADGARQSHALLDAVGLADKRDSRPAELSGGQRQRVAIARALAGYPPLILADEPTAALDAQNGLAITELMRRLAREHGHTVVCVTHDNRIHHLADRIVRIEDGLIQPAPGAAPQELR